MRQHQFLLVMIATCALSIAGCGGGSGLVAMDDEQPVLALPSLDGLPQPTGGPAQRQVSDAEYNVMLAAPVSASPDGSALHGGGELTLAPSLNDGLAWAIYALPGFPTDGSIVPMKVTVAKGAPEIWIGLSNYETGGWDFLKFAYSGYESLANGADLFSGTGMMYLAVLAAKSQVGVYSVTITTSDDLPGAPLAVINAPERILEGYEVAFDAIGSTGGDGSITELVWTFDGGDQQTTSDPATEVKHTFNTSGVHTVGLTVRNDLARTGHTDLPVNVEAIDWVTDLLIVYNSEMPEDLDLVEYYSSPLTGRAIHEDYRLGLLLGADAGIQISRDDFELNIRQPIVAFLDDPANSAIKASIKYLLMMKGVPYKIPGIDQFNINSTYSSVDSELCCMYSYGSYAVESFLWSQLGYQTFNIDEPESLYLTTDNDFAPGAYKASDSLGRRFTVDYLVGRLSAYNYDEARALVDRSLAADTSATGWIILDSKPSIASRDTMVEPVWPLTSTEPNPAWPSAYKLLTEAGLNVYLDNTNTNVTWQTAGLPAEVADGVIAYDGHGKHAGFAGDYILNALGFNYLPGACFMSIESFNCWDLDDTDGSVSRNSDQGLIGDFLRMGGTCAIGNSWEPFVHGVGDERWVFDRYLHHGDRWIEAAYKGLRCLSWQEVVIGDPLCRVVPE